MIKNKYIFSALFNAFAQFFYFILIIKITQTNSISAILVVCLAVFLGNLIPQYLVNKLEKDKIWIYEITPNNSKQAKKLADKLRQQNLAVMTFKSYLDANNKTLNVRVYSKSKAESKLIQDLIPNNYTYCVNEVRDIS